ncbi:MAG TPA: CBS domain-containing protein [Oligoflexia bacterium]|nr:CBS domain-containing protein [Oligoflexia bacterium]HMP49276.1 CBS domain-containing protein [Oligoflexia bacterium]
MAFLWIDRDRSVREPYEYKSLQKSPRVPSAKAVEGVDPDRSSGNPLFLPDSDASKKDSSRGHEAYQAAIEKRKLERVFFAEHIMTSPVKTLDSSTSLEEAINFIQENRFRHIPVVSDSGHLLGIVSDRDLFKHYFQVKEGMTNLVDNISGLIRTRILTATPDTHLREIAKIMFEERIGAMPILGPEDGLAGIITRSDILRAMVNKAPLELWV